MGYVTRYELSVLGPNGLRDYGVQTAFGAAHVAKYDGPYALDEEGETNEDVKWYDYEDDVREFSRQYPDHIFVVKADGEESGDHRLTYAKNGKLQKAEITWIFEPFDPKKLR